MNLKMLTHNCPNGILIQDTDGFKSQFVFG